MALHECGFCFGHLARWRIPEPLDDDGDASVALWRKGCTASTERDENHRELHARGNEPKSLQV